MCIDFREKKKSSLQCISGFFCLHVNRPFSGFFILQTSIRSKSPPLSTVAIYDFQRFFCGFLQGHLFNVSQHPLKLQSPLIDHFTFVDLVSQPSSECEAEVDLVLIQASFALLWKLPLKNTSQHKNREVCIETRSPPASLPSITVNNYDLSALDIC